MALPQPVRQATVSRGRAGLGIRLPGGILGSRWTIPCSTPTTHGGADVAVHGGVAPSLGVLLAKVAARVKTGVVARVSVSLVLLLGVLGSSEALQGVKDVLEYLRVYVSRPQKVEVFIVRDLSRHSLGGQLAQHDFYVYQRVAASVY